ncbi:DUF3679 domain-containing protein [Pontibacillus yanchengensis]|uniref:DUF3679 domain-containing protein n=1 Tax=Pontibacillus yanchengensis Y32 TaxID=1385514 RepID=A0A0A2TGE2_9BACI|nr:DUF3679 domain-containing protein [Pontibacillus yanchengensis]KGP73181.1 hypothetical protein N782_07155 [Pontibacillus yanchengensis Y32]
MVRFTVTFLIMVILFMSGVLLGMNQASLGMIQMRGFSDTNFHEAIKTQQPTSSNYEVEVLGKEFQQVPVEEKQQVYADMQITHGVQKLAFTLEKGVKWVYNTMIFVVYQLVQVFFA